ncbi:carbohydrate ABC transporter ATP-binding protein, CUT1 family [Marininema mesophilum]|uniref:Carbohydrate ABC transporter ATP-binding protein, CUT1 family n=1 Tax=Marininema mesophilum TaxID=1048340 RepID=A0A1H2TN82_9BACL|nr:ABC transporter ATP-binding protein [Marininema mesophilum]SDW45237.1 carbohydrate ABC transporter ATP-binding protein, CUT1 family [Marininema mesophilum]
MAQMTLNHISKRYEDEITAVSDFHLHIRDQEFLVLVGPSGCGKSTMLRMIVGLETISSGEVIIGDEVVNDVPAKDRDIAMVFQGYALYPHLNVYDNIAFALKMKKCDKHTMDCRVREVAKLMGLEYLLDRKPESLSGGERQRVALGRAIICEPRVFLMDEPLSNLDAQLRVKMRTEIIQLHQRLKTTMIYVTHDQTEAMTMADRIVVMREGVIQQVATPAEIYQHPANLFVAGFIGSPSMNFAEGLLMESDHAIIFQGNGLHVKLSTVQGDYLREQGYIGHEVIFGIRPEDIQDDPLLLELHHAHQVRGCVEVAENMGSEMVLYLSGIADKWITARVRHQPSFEVGDEITLALDINQAHIFDKATEEAVF